MIIRVEIESARGFETDTCTDSASPSDTSHDNESCAADSQADSISAGNWPSELASTYPWPDSFRVTFCNQVAPESCLGIQGHDNSGQESGVHCYLAAAYLDITAVVAYG